MTLVCAKAFTMEFLLRSLKYSQCCFDSKVKCWGASAELHDICSNTRKSSLVKVKVRNLVLISKSKKTLAKDWFIKEEWNQSHNDNVCMNQIQGETVTLKGNSRLTSCHSFFSERKRLPQYVWNLVSGPPRINKLQLQVPSLLQKELFRS